jgi:hypothetical protein
MENGFLRNALAPASSACVLSTGLPYALIMRMGSAESFGEPRM